MASTFEISDQRSEPSAEKAGAARGFIERRVVDLLALFAPASVGAKANDRDHLARQGKFDLLNDFGRQFAGHDRSVAVRAFDAMKIGVGHLVIGKERPLVPWMAWLPTAFSFLAVLWLVCGFLDDVAGGRLGGVGGILAEPLFEVGDSLLKGLHQPGDGHLRLGRKCLPESLRDRWLSHHATVLQNSSRKGNIGA